MPEEKGYNGWSNYETWAVKLWIDNEEGSYNYWREIAQEIWDEHNEGRYEWESREDRFVSDLADRLKDEHEENAPTVDQASVYTDLMNAALSVVDWREIANTYLEEIDKKEDEETEVEE